MGLLVPGLDRQFGIYPLVPEESLFFSGVHLGLGLAVGRVVVEGRQLLHRQGGLEHVPLGLPFCCLLRQKAAACRSSPQGGQGMLSGTA